jgi:glyoxylase-like metal-dependent hydrolase (beta-lactamase superfamily II)
VNIYRVEDDPLTLVDAGPNSGTSFDGLIAALRHSLEDIEMVISRHPHIDHLGLVSLVAARSGRWRRSTPQPFVEATRPKPPRTSSSRSTRRRRERHWAWRTPQDLSCLRPRSPSQPLHDVVRCPLGHSGHAGEMLGNGFSALSECS